MYFIPVTTWRLCTYDTNSGDKLCTVDINNNTKKAGSTPSVLIIGPSWVGDMVMMQSLCITLKQQNPNTIIDVVAPTWSLPILERMREVRDAIALDLQHGELGLGKRWQLGRMLSQKGYNRAIVIPRSLKSALVPFFAGIPKRRGYLGEMRYLLLNDIKKLDKGVLTQTVQRYVALSHNGDDRVAPSIPFPELRVSEKGRDNLVKKFGLGDGNIVALLPGAEYGPAKQWPLEHFAEVGAELCRRGKQVVVMGSDKDHADGEKITSLADGEILNLCGETSLEEAVDLLSLCDLAITNDSGLMHLAAAVGVEMVAIYGSSTPDYTPPLTERASIFYRQLECSPCFERECRFGHAKCLAEITPQQVLALIHHN